MQKTAVLSVCFSAFVSTAICLPAMAQVPVIDNATLRESQQTARNTREIMTTNNQIMENVKKTLEAVSGSRTGEAQGLSQIALGSGFNVGQAPSLGSALSGGSLSFGGLSGESQQMMSTLINGLQLVKSISGLMNGQKTTTDQSYQSSVNTAATLAGLISATQGAASARTGAFTGAGQSLGSARDIKGSIDQNTQVQIQTGQTVNELIGVMNNVVTAQQVQNLQRLAAESSTAVMMNYDPGKSGFAASQTTGATVRTR